MAATDTFHLASPCSVCHLRLIQQRFIRRSIGSQIAAGPATAVNCGSRTLVQRQTKRNHLFPVVILRLLCQPQTICDFCLQASTLWQVVFILLQATLLVINQYIHSWSDRFEATTSCYSDDTRLSIKIIAFRRRRTRNAF